MRTRFLSVDYFTRQTLAPPPHPSAVLLRLPVPSVADPPQPPHPFPEAEFGALDLELTVSYEFYGSLPGADTALTRFLEEVLPLSYGAADGRGFPVLLSSTENVGEVETRNVFSSDDTIKCEKNRHLEDLDTEIIQCLPQLAIKVKGAKIQSSFWSNSREKENQQRQGSAAITFETPELLESPLPCEEGEGILLEYPYIKIHMDNLDIIYEEVTPCPHEVMETIYFIDDLSIKYNVDYLTSHVEVNKMVKDKKVKCHNKILNYEVVEIDSESFSSPLWEEDFQMLLSNIEPHQCTNSDFNTDIGRKIEVIDILQCLSEETSTENFLSPPLISLISVLELDSISLPNKSEADGLPFLLPVTLHFDEVDIIDLECFQTFEDAASSLKASEQIQAEDMNFAECVYDNLVNAELALMDENFMSFPVPAVCDAKEISSMSSSLCLIIAGLREHSASASDEIYLDWHLLQEDSCNRYSQTTCNKILQELDTYESTLSLEPTDEVVLLDLILHDESHEKLAIWESKEVNNNPPDVSVVKKTNPKTQESHLSKDKHQTEITIVSVNPHKSSLNLNAISRSNDLKFFLSSRECYSRKNSVNYMEESSNHTVMLPVVPDPILICDSPEVKRLSLDIKVHQVKLSQDILDLVDYMGKFYLCKLKNDTELRSNDIFQDDLELLRFPKKDMMELISDILLTSSCEDKTVMAYAGLYVIKQMAYYICFYGIDSCHQYLEHICLHYKSLMITLRPLKRMIKDAYQKAEDKIIEYHPSLSAFEEILHSVSSRGKTKLIIAEKVVWCLLCRKLTDMGISFHIVKDGAICLKELDYTNHSEVPEEALKHSECLLLSHENIYLSFPFDKFGLVIEYGGAHGSSRIHTNSSEFPGLACIHFVKVELDEFSVPSALCEGSNIFLHHKKMESSFQPMSAAKEAPSHHKLLELLDFVPVLEDTTVASAHSADKVEASHLHESSSHALFDTGVQLINELLPFSPDTIVIVNTCNSDKEMVISRRSSYQKILRMEQEGVQIVERDYDLPVDLIFSAGSCLVWYKVETGTPLRTLSSCLTEYMENIAIDILMSISFAFSCCTLVFEGDNSFLDAVMDSVDVMNEAAARLDMNLQLFCSYSPDLTDEIILNCIKNAKILNCGLYPPMPESETLAESFLTSFPSINPLSAHAFISSIGVLMDVLYWSHEQRTQALRNYNIPQESISMFSALCRYGDLGESKSGTTECSSVSSALDSDNSSSKMQCKRKRHDYAVVEGCKYEPQSIELHSGRKNIVPKHPVIIRKPDIHDILVQNESLEQNRGRGPSVIHGNDWNDLKSIGRGEIINHNDYQLDNGLASRGNSRSSRRKLTFDTSDYPTFPNSAEVDCGSDILTPSKDHDNIQNNRHEAIGCSSSAWDYEFSPMMNTKLGRKPAFNKRKNVSFPSLPEFESDMDFRRPFKEHSELFKDITGHGLESGVRSPFKEHGELVEDITGQGLVSGVEAFPLTIRGEFSGERPLHSSSRNAFQKRMESSSGEKQCATAIHSSQLQQGSRWTIEFLDRIKEKTRKQQISVQSLPCNTCMDCPGSSKRIGKYVKRQSPSCLDSYSYQGASHLKKMLPWTLQKRRRQSLDLYNTEKASQPSLCEWTPLDKRARKVLSYARNGNERQSKLVWGDVNARNLRKKCSS